MLLALLYGQGVLGLALRLNISEDEAVAISGCSEGGDARNHGTDRQDCGATATSGAVQTVSGRIAPLERDYRSEVHLHR